MKLDLIAIRKLSPPKLWDLAQLTALISTLLSVIRCGFCDAATVRLSGRMLKQYRRELRERALDNFNMRVKAWVMQCPDRIAYVRSVIGEVAIKRWHKNRLLDYAFTQVFGDWKAAFLHGLRRQDKAPKQKFFRTSTRKFRTYVWKPFALVKIPNAERILLGQETSNLTTNTKGMRAAYLKLWGVDITGISDGGNNKHPRCPRAMKPVRFRPDELVEEAATGVLEDVLDDAQTAKLANSAPEIFPPPSTEQKSAEPAEASLEYKPP